MIRAVRIVGLAVLLLALGACEGGTLELTGEGTACLSHAQCPFGHICLESGVCVPSSALVQIEYEEEDVSGGDDVGDAAGGDAGDGVGDAPAAVEIEADVPERAPCLTEPCDDSNPCTEDVCDPDKGCVFEPLDAVPCDDGKVCTTGDTCADGVCGGDYDLCLDDNPCTYDNCESDAGCVHEPLSDVPCEDGDACTASGGCVAGACVTEPVICPAAGPCLDVSCDPAQGCVAVPNQGPCDDGDACTTDDQCAAGACGGVPLPCDCHTSADCGVLDDGDACNGVLFCDFSALPFVCAVDPLTVVQCPAATGPDQGCVESTCDPEAGSCSFIALADGGPCEDGDLCTAAELCAAGQCLPHEAVDCSDGEACTTDECLAATGCSHTDKVAPCDDGDACTAGDACQAGACAGAPVDCDDIDPCTDDSCSPLLGCAHVPNSGAPCEDGSACTIGDSCAAGSCASGAPPDCEDSNPCTTDSCLPLVGCVNAPNEASCDDDDVCTTWDTCALGACVGGPPLDCGDGDACTLDPCDPATGCSHTDASAACDDANPCTSDSCLPAVGCVNDDEWDGTSCEDGVCYQGACCTPLCGGKECGDDTCGGTCGACAGGEGCEVGVCVQQIPALSWVPIDGGLYWMGCATGLCEDPDEYPSHSVAVQPFELLDTEVTEAQFAVAMGTNPSCVAGGADHPAECLAWSDAAEFCARVGGRLPTEAEWELALRAATSTAWACGDEWTCLNGVAWYSDVAKHETAGLAPNALGLYDMTGNVREWVADCYQASYVGAPSVGFPAWETPCSSGRVVRGCGFLDEAAACSAFERAGLAPETADAPDIGFRCARTP